MVGAPTAGASRAGRITGRVGAGVAATGAAVYQPWLLVIAIVIVLVLVVGVFLPAVWSRRRWRRKAAESLVQRILDAFSPK